MHQLETHGKRGQVVTVLPYSGVVFQQITGGKKFVQHPFHSIRVILRDVGIDSRKIVLGLLLLDHLDTSTGTPVVHGLEQTPFAQLDSQPSIEPL